MTDRSLILGAAFLRSLATGMIGVLIGIYLARRGYDAAEIGLVVGAGLGGAAVAALAVTLLGERLGRRRVLVFVAMLGAAGGLGTVFATQLGIVVAAAFLGMLNGMGRDRGASLIIDQVLLPATASDSQRTTAFAWYNVLQDAGHALGGLAAAAPALLRQTTGMDELASARTAMVAYCAVLLATAVICAGLSPATEAPRTSAKLSLSLETRRSSGGSRHCSRSTASREDSSRPRSSRSSSSSVSVSPRVRWARCSSARGSPTPPSRRGSPTSFASPRGPRERSS